MRRLTTFLMIALLPAAMTSALEICIAPVLYVDETGENIRDAATIQSDLVTAFHGKETGVVLQFNWLKDNLINPPSSLFDAVSLSRNERIEYLIYGYVTKREHTIQAELRLFEYSSRTVLQSFFGMDATDHYNRLIQDMAEKIVQYINDKFLLDISMENTQVTRLTIPVSAGYWTPLDSGWIRAMLGSVSAGSGLIFIPSDSMWIVRGIPLYLSTGLEAKYRLGIGNPAGYEAFDHTMYLTMPLRMHIALTKRHELFMGLGYTYFLEFFSMADKYSDRKTHVYHNMGLYAGFGYRFAISRNLFLYFRNDFDFLFNERSLITYAPVLGLEIQIYQKEMQKKW